MSPEGEQEPDVEAARRPQPKAVRADDQLSDRSPQPPAAWLLLDLGGAAPLLKLREQGPREHGDLVLGDEAAELVAGCADQGQVVRSHALRRSWPARRAASRAPAKPAFRSAANAAYDANGGCCEGSAYPAKGLPAGSGSASTLIARAYPRAPPVNVAAAAADAPLGCARGELAAALDLGVQLLSEQHCEIPDPEPDQKGDHASERAIGLVVGAEVGNIEGEPSPASSHSDTASRLPGVTG